MAARGRNAIQSYVRVRPPTSGERKSGDTSGLTIDTAANTIATRTSKFKADKVFSQHASQQQVYRTVAEPMEDDVIDGFNCVLFAYGQTGTGKTHTMEGQIEDPAMAGLIPRMTTSLFEKLEASGKSFRIYCSAVELYNERFIECIDSTESGNSKVIKLHESKLVNAERVLLDNAEHALQLLRQAQMTRQTSSTAMNKTSSRSHFIFSLQATIRSGGGLEGSEACVTTGTLSVVDLAGSECIGKSGVVGKQARESKNINKSNEALKRVVEALGRHASHIPYRDSKLTQLLEPALGGCAKTAIIGTVGPAKANIAESKSTMNFVANTKKIKNEAKRNEGTTDAGATAELSSENDQLRRLLAAARSGSDATITKVPTELWVKTQAEVDEQKSRIADFQALVNERSAELESQLHENKTLLDAVRVAQEKAAAQAAVLAATAATLERTEAERVAEALRADVGEYEAQTHHVFAATQAKRARAQQNELVRQAHSSALLADAGARRSALVVANLKRADRFASDVAPLLSSVTVTAQGYSATRSAEASVAAAEARVWAPSTALRAPRICYSPRVRTKRSAAGSRIAHPH